MCDFYAVCARRAQATYTKIDGNMYKNSGLHVKSVDCVVDYDHTKKLATLTPILYIECSQKQLLAASVHIDDHELRPSLTIVVDEGEHEYQVPPVKIGNPVLNDYVYKLTVKLHLDNEQTYDLDQDVIIK